MKFSLRARLALAAALAATLGGKAALSRPAAGSDTQLLATRAAALFRANGFATRADHHPFGTILHAAGGGCRIMLADYPPHGTMAEPLSLLARPIGPLRYVWRGEMRASAPKLVALVSFFVQRELRRIGLSPPRQPLIAVAASPQCGLAPIDWSALATLPA